MKDGFYPENASSPTPSGNQPKSCPNGVMKMEAIDPIDPHADRLTGLPTFVDLQNRFDTELPAITGDGWCVISIDVEHFKLLSEWFGQQTAESFLCAVSEALKKYNVTEGGASGYLGQDRFCTVVPFDEEKIAALRDSLTEILRSSFTIDGFSVVFGVAHVDGSCGNLRRYFSHAALAAEEKLSDSKAKIRYYDVDLYARYSEEYRTLCEFESAIKNGQITFWLQPQFEVTTRRIVGAESLARWIKPDGETVPPSFFVPVLEKFGRICSLDTYIWEEVCRWISARKRSGAPYVPISVNVSRVDIYSMDVPEHIRSLSEKYGLDARDLKIEITESAYAEDSGNSDFEIKRLREMGYTVMMDDFGSGYSSLNMLKRLPLDVIKLDAQFVRIKNEERKRGINILESIVGMTKQIGMPIIVEGVETREQVRFLSDLGCRYMQGYYFAAPMPKDEFAAIISLDGKIDPAGVVFKQSGQLRIAEFIGKNAVSDAMINNIIGAVAIYRRNGDNVDITRYNEQFFDLVGISASHMERRRHGIQRYLVADDVPKLYSILDYAVAHPEVGSEGTVRAIRPSGAVVSFSLKVYHLKNGPDGDDFYCSARDVTELQILDYDLPGAYFRCTLDPGYPFSFVSENFKTLTGYTADDLAELFDNKFLNMVHPAERGRLSERFSPFRSASEEVRPYRIRVKNGEYIWIAEQGSVTDHFGIPCRQCVALNVSDVMKIRNQMRLLSKYLTDSIIFLRRRPSGPEFEVAVHGLDDAIGADAASFAAMLNSGEFFDSVNYGRGETDPGARAHSFAQEAESSDLELEYRRENGDVIVLVARSYRVKDERSADERSSAEFIIVLRR